MLSFRRLTVWLGLLAAAFPGRSMADEHNLWPAVVQQVNPAGVVESWNGLGPLFFDQPSSDGGRTSGFRPFYVQHLDAKGQQTEFTVLYPLYVYRSYGETYKSSVFDLINRYGRKDGAPATTRTDEQTFDVWPFYFSRETGDPATSYHGVFPIAGTLEDFLGISRVSWTLFPLYFQTERHGVVTTATPWPILRVTRGAEHGFALWPLFGWDDSPGVFHREYCFWPLIWDNTIEPGPEKPAGTAPTQQEGFLPFYSSERGPGMVNESYLWPFFGYTDRTAPDHYHETRYFWPLLVQGQGDGKLVDRWGPFYTHSVYKGVDKTWVLWPLWRQERLTDGGVAQTKTQFFYFLYWDLTQRSLTNPKAAPAEKRHVWPLFSSWDNGAGRHQFQLLSPLEVFLPNSTEMRETWTPFFSLIRSDQEASGDRRTSLLWDAVTWESHPQTGSAAFHLGPLLSVEKKPAGRRWAVAGGLFGWKRAAAGGGWRPFVMEFSPKSDQPASLPAK